MKKWILIGLLGVIAVVVLLGFLGWNALNKPIDPNSAAGQGYATNFKKQFADSCVQSAEAAAPGLDDATKAKLAEMCGCGAEATYEAFKNEPPAKLLALSADSESAQKVGDIMKACAEQAGVQ